MSNGDLCDGRTERQRLVLVGVSGGEVAALPLEDLIAERMGQYVSVPRRVPEMREQAVVLYALAGELDEAYLDRRIKEETIGELALSDLETWRKQLP